MSGVQLRLDARLSFRGSFFACLDFRLGEFDQGADEFIFRFARDAGDALFLRQFLQFLAA